MAFVREQLEHEVAVLFTQGQHEFRKLPWLNAISDGPMHVHRRLFTIPVPYSNFDVYGLDWQPATQLAAALEGIPPAALALMCHQVWSPLMGGPVATEGDLRQVHGVRLILTGDCHKHVRLDLERDNGTPVTVLSPGSLCMQSIDEEPDKAFFTVGMDDQDQFVIESVPLKSRPFHEVTLATAADVETMTRLWLPAYDALVAQSDLPPEIRKPLLRVRLKEELPGARDAIKAKAGERYHLFFDQAPRSAIAVQTLDQGIRREALETLRERGLFGTLAEAEIAGADDAELVRTALGVLLKARPEERAALLDRLIEAW